MSSLSFSLVHIRPYEKPFLNFAALGDQTADPFAIGFQSSEEAMVRLDEAIRTRPAVTLVAPAGFGAETLLREWAEMQQRAGFADFAYTPQNGLRFRMKPGGQLRTVRIVRFCDYVPAAGESPVILGNVGDLEDAQELHASEHEQQVTSVGTTAGRVPRIKKLFSPAALRSTPCRKF